MKFPKTIKIGAYSFTTKTFPQIEEPDKRGWINYTDQEIAVTKDRSDDIQKEVFLHELCHASFWNGGLEGNEGEEKIVTVLATQLYGIFKDNPKLKEVFFG